MHPRIGMLYLAQLDSRTRANGEGQQPRQNPGVRAVSVSETRDAEASRRRVIVAAAIVAALLLLIVVAI